MSSLFTVFFDDQVFQSQEYGGISRYFCALSGELAKEGVDVRLFAGISRNRHVLDLPKIQGLAVIHRRRKDRLRINTLMGRVSQIWRRWEFARIRRDVAHPVIYHPTFFAVDPWIAGRANATVVTVYDMISELFPSSIEAAATSLEMKRRAMLDAKLAICISESTRCDLLRCIPDLQTKVEVIPLAADLAKPAAEVERQATDLGPFLLLVGQRGGYKNGIAGFKTFRLLAKTDHDLKLVCYGGKSPTPEEMEAAGGGEIAGRIRHFVGDDTQLTALYRNAIALLYPSRYEGFGLPVLEAMQAGCPVITPPLSSLPEVGGDAAVYIQPDDFPAAAAAVKMLMAEPAARQARQSMGIKRSKLFSWRKTALQTKQAYHAALAANSCVHR